MREGDRVGKRVRKRGEGRSTGGSRVWQGDRGMLNERGILWQGEGEGGRGSCLAEEEGGNRIWQGEKGVGLGGVNFDRGEDWE